MKKATELIRKFNKSKFNLPVRNILLAIVVSLTVEMLSRHSVLKGFAFMFTRPFQFVYGVLIVLFTLSFCLLVKRKIFVKTLICAVWLIFGITNCILLSFRHTPFTAQDFRLIQYAFTVAPLYLSVPGIILIIVLSVLFVAGMTVWWFKSPMYKEKINYVRSVVMILSFWFVVWLVTKLGVIFGGLAQNFGNIGDAYKEYGFAYCFSSSLLYSGIEKPKDYNEDTIKAILEKIEQYESERAANEEKENGKDAQGNVTDGGQQADGSGTGGAGGNVAGSGAGDTGGNAAGNGTGVTGGNVAGSGAGDTGGNSAGSGADGTDGNASGGAAGAQEKDDGRATKKYPNIIFVQLESLFDPQLIEGAEFSREVLPNLKRLYGEFPSGFLSVPSVGAGTANTEFEVISGMNLNDFGPGEYPYKTILTHSACESVCFDLKKYGYTTNALHNNEGTFYDRNKVFSQLGFDTFTSMEYMDGLEYNELGWADDSVLTGEIIGILNNSPQRDFIYAISVQGHGDYPEEYAAAENDITVSGDSVSEYVNQLMYYANQIHQMDEFVGELVDAVADNGEPAVVVMYGDHIPAFDITDENLILGNIYTTQYVIWNNIGIENINEDIEAFQLTSCLLDMLGIEGGAISKYHITLRNTEEKEEYLKGLKILEYDILYGDRNVYGGELPYAQTNLKMGYKNITVASAGNADEHVIVTGENFTPYSVVAINGEYYDTIYSSGNVLLVDGVRLNDGDTVAVVQKGRDGIVLGSTSLYVFGSRK